MKRGWKPLAASINSGLNLRLRFQSKPQWKEDRNCWSFVATSHPRLGLVLFQSKPQWKEDGNSLSSSRTCLCKTPRFNQNLNEKRMETQHS
jgi:hypothetical protein